MIEPGRPAVHRSERPAPIEAVGVVVAVAGLSGLASAVFLWSLDDAVGLFDRHPWLVVTLPVCGLVVGLAGTGVGHRANAGMTTVIATWREPREGVPVLLGAWALVGTLMTHVVGGSAGREGTAVQMASAIADPLARRRAWAPEQRRWLLGVAVASGFASVFGVPWAGVVFAAEIRPSVDGRAWWTDRAAARSVLGQIPVLAAAAWVAHLVVVAVGPDHSARLAIPAVGLVDLGWCLLAGAVFGLVAFGFVRSVDGVRWTHRRIGLPVWARPVAGGFVVAAVVLVSRRTDVAGLSLDLLDEALAGRDPGFASTVLKLGLTAVTVASGFRGGEVTPLFVMGATAGAALASWWGAPIPLLAAAGMVAVFGAATNASVAAAVLGVELFGWGPLPAILAACAVARMCSGPHHLYADGDASLPDDVSRPDGVGGRP